MHDTICTYMYASHKTEFKFTQYETSQHELELFQHYKLVVSNLYQFRSHGEEWWRPLTGTDNSIDSKNIYYMKNK